MRILFIGCVESSYLLLEKLIEMQVEVCGVITKEASALNADFRDVTPLCRRAGIPYHFVKNINDEDALAFVRETRPDVAFCFGWSQLVRRPFMELIPQGIVGFHPAALPHNRGRHPIIWALVLGLAETASTFFYIDEQADHGAIVSQTAVSISYEDDAASLYHRIMETAVQQVATFVPQMEAGTLTVLPQARQEGNSWRKRGKADGEIDWRMGSRAIYNLVRALRPPYVGAHFVHDGQEYKVWRVQEGPADGMENLEPGKIVRVAPDGSFDVKVADGILRVLESEYREAKAGEYL